MPDNSNEDETQRDYLVVGRDERVDLERYTVRILGRDIIDYEKLRREDSELYNDIVRGEAESDRRRKKYLDDLLKSRS